MKGLIKCVLLATMAGLAGCEYSFQHAFKASVHPETGEIKLSGLSQPVEIKRDARGIPFIQAQNSDDLAFAMGYSHASDRLAQMTGMKLASQGRLSEMMGPVALDMDIYMRSQNTVEAGRIILEGCSDDIKRLLQMYAKGVNAYLEAHQDHLPPNLAMSGYKPEPWKAEDSASIFALLNLSLALNIHQEAFILNALPKVGADKMAWLTPIYPDEPLPFAEANKLANLDWKQTDESVQALIAVQTQLTELFHNRNAASNNWAIAPARTKQGASLFANDTHLLLSLPSLWSMMHARSPEYDAAGVTLAGLPGIVAGYNGHIAWGETMVMADNQDLFLEKLKWENNKLFYLYQDQWRQAEERKEIFKIKGQSDQQKIIYQTVHGPLLNTALQHAPKMEVQAPQVTAAYGLAMSWDAFKTDSTMNAFLALGRAKSVAEANVLTKQIRAIPVNLVYADRDNIAWQVTGRYPIRKNGRGLYPSPGWSGEYDWIGDAEVALHPFVQNPADAFVGTANNRTVAADYPLVLSSSWFYPERGERIQQLAKAKSDHDFASMKAMQLDQVSLFAEKLKATLAKETDLAAAINKLPETQRKKAQKTLAVLTSFNGDLKPGSRDAAVFEMFQVEALKALFLDELGPESSAAWQGLVAASMLTYSALQDHLILRGDESPYWDNVSTVDKKETRAEMLAKTLAISWEKLEFQLGNNDANWKWGTLHQYHWRSDSSKIAPHLDAVSQFVIKLLAPQFDVEAIPAGGDQNTLNVTGYPMSLSWGVETVPEMRIIVDFSQPEPMWGMNSTGQSDNPASAHYKDGVYSFVQADYKSFPFQQPEIDNIYKNKFVLVPK